MAESARQKRITGRVMHEFKHGELKSGPGGKGGPVSAGRPSPSRWRRPARRSMRARAVMSATRRGVRTLTEPLRIYLIVMT